MQKKLKVDLGVVGGYVLAIVVLLVVMALIVVWVR